MLKATDDGRFLPFRNSTTSLQDYASSKKRKRFILVISALCVTTLLSSGTVFDPLFSLLSSARLLCQAFFKGDLDANEPYWENDYPAITDYSGQDRTLPGGSNNIGFVINLNSCPDDYLYKPAVDTQYDPGHALYDAAAILKHSIEKSLEISGKYNATMHAIVHPNAIACDNPNGDPYDRVKVLESLGYYVNILASPIKNTAAISSAHVRENIENDVGSRDLTRLYAANYDNHPAVVLMDFDAIVMKPLDTIIDKFLDDGDAKIAFGAPPVGDNTVTSLFLSFTDPTIVPTFDAIPLNSAVDIGLILLKPNPDLVTDITDKFENTQYDVENGWDESGVGNFDGALGSSGILTYYYTSVEPGAVMIFDHCSYGNNLSGECISKPTQEVVVGRFSACGHPWTCPDLSGISPAEKEKCEVFEKHWYELRKDFEDNCWVGGPTASRDGAYQNEIALGFCSANGFESYHRLVTDLAAPFSCDPDTFTSSVENTLYYNEGRFQIQKLTLTTGEHTGQSDSCVSGSVMKSGFEPPYNICIVIDVSGSTRGGFGGSPVGDVNSDNRYNTILDAEIASVIQILEYIATSGALTNENVNIGIVTFSRSAEYHGMFEPCNPTNPKEVNPSLISLLLSLRGSGLTHFDDALDKAIEFFEEAPTDRSQLMFFLSDGIPNMSGDGDEEESPNSYAGNNHISALTYHSELVKLDSFNVKRLAVGVGSGSDVRPGYGLALIDNTPDENTGEGPQKVTSTDALTETLMSNPVTGNVVSFEVEVNGEIDNNFGINDIHQGPLGFTYSLVASDLNPLFDNVNRVKVTVIVDYDGDINTTADQHSMSTENTILGAMQA